jgi:hypothetical protein
VTLTDDTHALLTHALLTHALLTNDAHARTSSSAMLMHAKIESIGIKNDEEFVGQHKTAAWRAQS